MINQINQKNIILNKVNESLSNENKELNMIISSNTARELLQELNPGCDHDSIHSRLQKESSDDLIDIVVTFINLCYQYYNLPYNFLKGDISPIVKDDKKCICYSSNY